MARRTLEQRIADAQAQVARLQEKERKTETRGLILLGSMVARMAAETPEIMESLHAEIATEKRPDNQAAMRFALDRRAKGGFAPQTPQDISSKPDE